MCGVVSYTTNVKEWPFSVLTECHTDGVTVTRERVIDSCAYLLYAPVSVWEITATHLTGWCGGSSELVLKVRVAGLPEEADFVELQLPLAGLSLDTLLRECCRELDIDRQVRRHTVTAGWGSVGAVNRGGNW